MLQPSEVSKSLEPFCVFRALYRLHTYNYTCIYMYSSSGYNEQLSVNAEEYGIQYKVLTSSATLLVNYSCVHVTLYMYTRLLLC